jgi:adenylate cyclase
LYELNAKSFGKAQKVLLKAIEIAPDSCDAHWLLGSILYHQALMGYSTDQDKDLEEGYRLTRKAVALNEHNEYAHWILGLVELRRGDLQRSISEHRRALELNPNCALAYGGLGNALCYRGNTEEAIENSKLAIRFSPKDISIFFRFGTIAIAHFIAGCYEQAEVWARKSVQRKPSYLQGRACLIVALIYLNRLEEAKKAVAKYIEMEPNATTARAMKYMPFKEPEWEERFRDGLRKAGMPE